jgi:UDP-N-acetylmuramate dehydrogenase
MDSTQKKTLASLVHVPVEWDCMMGRYTSFSIGGPALALVRAGNCSELRNVLQFLRSENLSWRVIGRGSNLLVSDVLDGTFKEVSSRTNPEDGSVRLAAGAGCSFARLQKYCIESALTGLEFGFGIPGSLGGAVVMNAGAWGDEIASLISSVTLISPEETVTLQRNQMRFSYRSWDDFRRWQGRGVVAEVELRLGRGDAGAVRQKCTALQEKRRQSQPRGYPNAGSFFKNPPGESAGRLIDLCGLKGKTVGGAMVSTIHGNFLVNKGNATASEVKELMALIQECVKKEHGIDLQPEVHFI